MNKEDHRTEEQKILDLGTTIETKKMEVRCLCGSFIEIVLHKIEPRFTGRTYWKANNSNFEKHYEYCRPVKILKDP